MVKIILDTDIGGDCDDAGAMGLLNTLADNGKCEILAMASCMRIFENVLCLDIINRYYGRDDIPTGMTCPDIPDESHDGQGYGVKIAGLYTSGLTRNTIENAVSLYRRILAEQPDNSVVFVMIGPQNNFADLLKSAPDSVSPLNGSDLVMAKVEKVVCMGGYFAGKNEETFAEYNIQWQIPAAQYAALNCPVPMVYSPFDVGGYCFTGGNLKDLYGNENPIKLSYEFHGSAEGRNSWDLCTVYYAVLGCGELFCESEKGTVTVNDEGITSFSPNKKGLHSYLKNKANDEIIAAELNKLIDQKPKKQALTRYNPKKYYKMLKCRNIIFPIDRAAVFVVKYYLFNLKQYMFLNNCTKRRAKT